MCKAETHLHLNIYMEFCFCAVYTYAFMGWCLGTGTVVNLPYQLHRLCRICWIKNGKLERKQSCTVLKYYHGITAYAWRDLWKTLRNSNLDNLTEDRDSNSGPSEYKVVLTATPQRLVWIVYMWVKTLKMWKSKHSCFIFWRSPVRILTGAPSVFAEVFEGFLCLGDWGNST